MKMRKASVTSTGGATRDPTSTRGYYVQKGHFEI